MKTKAIIGAAMLMACTMASAQTKETAVLFSGTEFDESYILTDQVSVVLDGNCAYISLDGEEQKGFIIVEDHPVTVEFKNAFKLKANQDPDNTSDYYTTFYTSEGAYKVPETAKAYAGKVETNVIKLTEVGSLIHKKEPVILKASQSEITLMPSCNKDSTSTKNALEGTDEGKNLTTNQYALSLGQNGVGFYLWDGKPIGANKAYMTLDKVAHAKAFTFIFEDGTTTAIEPPTVNCQQSGDAYNLNGIRVKGNYKGIVIKNGKKVYQR